MSTRCQRALSKVTDVSNLLGRTRTMWSGYSIMISDHFTDNYVDNIRSPVIDIANLSTIIDNDLTDLLDVPVCSDLNKL